MSILYRKKRIKKIIKYWDFKKIHDLMVEHNLNKSAYENFKYAVKNYISKAMNIDYEKN
mgnify:CR=1 FL=1